MGIKRLSNSVLGANHISHIVLVHNGVHYNAQLFAKIKAKPAWKCSWSNSSTQQHHDYPRRLQTMGGQHYDLDRFTELCLEKQKDLNEELKIIRSLKPEFDGL